MRTGGVFPTVVEIGSGGYCYASTYPASSQPSSPESRPWTALPAAARPMGSLNEQAQERLDTIMEQMKDAEGVTEELKRTQQMEWVRRCNNIHNRAEEIILQEMIYS